MTELPTTDGVTAWVEAWKDGWTRHDPDVIADRYAPDCIFRSEPFREMEHGRDAARSYAARSFAEERAARFTFGEPIVGSDGRAAVEYRAVIIAPDGSDITIHGVSLLRIDAAGLVAEHRDCWTGIDGDHDIELRKGAPE